MFLTHFTTDKSKGYFMLPNLVATIVNFILGNTICVAERTIEQSQKRHKYFFDSYPQKPHCTEMFNSNVTLNVRKRKKFMQKFLKSYW